MQDEIYDIYDDSGNIVGSATWHEVHKNGLLHHTSAILIFRDSSKKEILLQRRSSTMEQDPELWQHSAGGHIVSGDTPKEAIRKELREELFAGNELPIMDISEVLSFFLDEDLPNNKEILHLFEATYPGPFFYDHKEVGEEPRWVNFNELIEDMNINPDKYTEAFRRIVKEYMKIR